MINLIKAATLTNDTVKQKQAERLLIQYRNQQPEKFILENAQILNSGDIEGAVRHVAGTILARSLKEKIGESYLWYSVGAGNRTTCKDLVLNSMIDRDKNIRRAAANTVAAICCVEIPRNEWPGIIEKITSNIGSDDPTIKEVSVLTIGFICEQLKQFNFEFEESVQETILTGILMGTKDSHSQIAETSFKALRDGLPAMTAIMANTKYREFLMSQIVQAIKTRKDFIQLCMQAMNELVRCYYNLFNSNYIQAFFTHLGPILEDTSQEKSCILAMEFWTTLVKEEKDIESNPNMMKTITGPLGARLVQVLLQNMCFVDDQDEEEASGIREGAVNALQAIFDGDSEEYQKMILDFTEKTIQHQNWKYRQASILAFAILLIGLPLSRSQALVKSSLVQLAKLLNDKHRYVQMSALRSMSMISEEVPESIMQHQNFFNILEFIVKMGHCEPFLRSVCRIVDNLATSEQSYSVIGPHAGSLIKEFLQLCNEKERSNPSISACLNVIINLIKCSQSTQICNQYINFVLEQYPKLHGLQKQKRDLFYSGFFTMAQICLMTIRKANGSITMDQMSSLYNLVVDHYKRIKDVEGDGFYIVSALAYFIPNDRRLIDDFWKYIEYGLDKVEQEEIFKSTISCICDFATTYRDQISDKIDPILQRMFKLYEQNRITRDLKLDILMCIGELFLQCGDFCVKHLNSVMKIIMMACEGVVRGPEQAFAEILQESIIETLMCIFHGVSEEALMKELPAFLGHILQFIQITTDTSRHPKLDYVKECLMLLGDLSTLCPKFKPDIVKSGIIPDRAATLVKFNKDGHLTQNISYIKQQFNLHSI